MNGQELTGNFASMYETKTLPRFDDGPRADHPNHFASQYCGRCTMLFQDLLKATEHSHNPESGECIGAKYSNGRFSGCVQCFNECLDFIHDERQDNSGQLAGSDIRTHAEFQRRWNAWQSLLAKCKINASVSGTYRPIPTDNPDNEPAPVEPASGTAAVRGEYVPGGQGFSNLPGFSIDNGSAFDYAKSHYTGTSNTEPSASARRDEHGGISSHSVINQ